MADLPWNNFLQVAGDPRRNFEVLCRELIRRHYGSLGPLLTRKQQPGVEFHLRLKRPSETLGEAGRRWGWQCRWYEPDAFWSDGSRLRDAQRKNIVEAIEKTDIHEPGLSDWVLWTREKLGVEDVRWFEKLEAPFTLHRWDEETIIGLLSGPAEVLRRTWFGDLVLDQETLVRARKISLAPVEHRYEAELHIRTPPERYLKRVLPDLSTARQIGAHAAAMELAASDLQGHPDENELARRTRAALTDAAERAEEVVASIGSDRLPSAEEVREAAGDTGKLDELVAEIAGQAEADPDRSLGDARRALEATHSQLMQIAENLEQRLVVVVGGAGAGKTHLAAHLSGPDGVPAGVLLLGRLFETKIADDDIARVAGLGTSTEQLLESLEALGLRKGRRVPLVIDGINESDDASAWKDALARLGARLDRFRHVVTIVTLRPGYTKLALPAGSKGFRLEGFAGVESEAVARYFDYYKIRADRSAIDWWRPSDPLLLAIFCRVVNGERKEEVTASDLPRSLCEVFERHLEGIVVRIGEATGLDRDNASAGLGRLAHRFLETGARELEVAEVGEALGDQPLVKWKDSLRFQVESEEVLVRDVFEGREKALFGYDLLGGHLIAKDLLARHSPEEIAAEPLAGAIGAHPLREDIITGLTGLLGAAGREPSAALGADWAQASQVALASARLPDDQLGEASVVAIEVAFAERPELVLEEIAPVALRPDHPLNATVLDRLLGGLEVWRRDLIWSEWVRERSETIMLEVVGIERRLAEGKKEVGDPAVTLAWLSWLLTSTDKPLRDTVVKALYRLGQAEPQLLFNRAIKQLGEDDPAIPEGLLAAAYGVAMGSQETGAPMREAVIGFAAELQAHLLGPAADEPTWHWLIREYAYRTTQLAAWISGGEFEAPADAAQPPLPAPPGKARIFRPGSANWHSVDPAFHMDFANYTIGRLVEGRANYDDQHPRFQRISGEIRARVAELGWTARRFNELDRTISEGSYSRMNDPEKVERYGKKYSWAGFYEAAGRLSDRGELHGREPSSAGWRISDVPLDPSFPQTASMSRPEVAEWVPEGGSDEDWARNFQIELPDGLLRTEVDGRSWIAVDGYLNRAPAGSQRKVFCFIRGLVALESWSSIEAYLSEHPIEAELVPGNAAEYYCFAGEAPWSATFDSWATEADGTSTAERHRIGWRREDGPEIELLGVDFNWESYHSVLNEATIGSLPSKAFCRSAVLAKVADRAEFVDPNGEPAARALALSEEGWRGHVLWVREDLVEAYCMEQGGEWGWIVWGEREVHPPEPGARHELPDWMGEVRRKGLDRFNRVTSLAQLRAGESSDRT